MIDGHADLSESADLILTLLELALLKGISVEEAARVTEQNTRSFYRLEYLIDQGKPPALPVDSQSLTFAGVVIPAVFLSRNPGS